MFIPRKRPCTNSKDFFPLLLKRRNMVSSAAKILTVSSLKLERKEQHSEQLQNYKTSRRRSEKNMDLYGYKSRWLTGKSLHYRTEKRMREDRRQPHHVASSPNNRSGCSSLRTMMMLGAIESFAYVKADHQNSSNLRPPLNSSHRWSLSSRWCCGFGK